jgi:peptidoglycan L-alanyl-D-glutamate endopeptidase CwlK
LCGHRSKAEQDKAFADGFSKVQFPNSKHNSLPSMAVDVAPFPINWKDAEGWEKLGEIVWKCWQKLPISERAGYRLVWGGHWKKFKDSPHFEIVKD